MDDIPHRRETGLKPCPFCGEAEDIWHIGETDYVECQQCSAGVHLEHWNNRPEEDRLKEFDIHCKRKLMIFYVSLWAIFVIWLAGLCLAIWHLPTPIDVAAFLLGMGLFCGFVSVVENIVKRRSK